MQHTIAPCPSLDGQQVPSQQMYPLGQQVVVDGLLEFWQTVDVVPVAQAPQVPLLASVQIWPEGQQVEPHAWAAGQHAPPMHSSLESAQQSVPQHLLNGPQHVPPQACDGLGQQVPLTHEPPAQQLPS